MLLKLYCSSQNMPRNCSANEGFPSAMYLLWLLNKRGIDSEIVDTVTLLEKEIEIAYNEAVIPSVKKKHKIREIFGSKRRSRFRFGKDVPALLVYENVCKPPIDVYPHKVKQGDSKERFNVTIREYLAYLEWQKVDKPVLEYANRPLTWKERRRLRRR